MFVLQCVVLLMSAATWGQAAETGYVDYYPGTLNIILSAPHGGDLTPDDIPDRNFGCYIEDECVWAHDCGVKDEKRCKATIVTDTNTKQLTLKLRTALYKKFGGYPHVVISKLKRTKLDPNREKNQAAFNESSPGKAWEEYHGYLDKAKAEVSSSGPGIVFDIHGHGRPQEWAMIGVLINGPELKRNTFTVDQTSIKALVERQGKQHFEAILRGAASFGAYLVAEDFDAVPSPLNPHPDGAPFYRGGYITVRHGSRDGGIIDAIQIESPRTFRGERFDDYVESLATTIHGFVGRYYPMAEEDTREADSTSGTGTVSAHWYITERLGSRDNGINDATQIESSTTVGAEQFDDYVESLATTIHGYVGRYYPTAAAEEDTREADNTSGTGTVSAHWSVVVMVVSVVLSRLV